MKKLAYEDLNILLNYDFIDVKCTNPYEIRRMKGKGVVVLYSTGKLLIQADNEQKEKIEKILLGRASKHSYPLSSNVMIGSDESLKGDTFGGIVVAGVRADAKLRNKLMQIKVQDSKKISNAGIETIAKKLIVILEGNFALRELYPDEYNLIKNQTLLLNLMHKQVIRELRREEEKAIVDKYPGCKIALKNVVLMHKAESKSVEVAAASIIARYYALKQIKELSKKAGFELPLGSTHVREALLKIKNKGLNIREFAKINFKNVRNVFD